jgi:hypothetical protein
MEMCTLDGIVVHITIRQKNNELVDVRHGVNVNA